MSKKADEKKVVEKSSESSTSQSNIKHSGWCDLFLFTDTGNENSLYFSVELMAEVDQSNKYLVATNKVVVVFL